MTERSMIAQVIYTSVEGDPLWFSIGKGVEDLIPTGERLYSGCPMFTYS